MRLRESSFLNIYQRNCLWNHHVCSLCKPLVHKASVKQGWKQPRTQAIFSYTRCTATKTLGTRMGWKLMRVAVLINSHQLWAGQIYFESLTVAHCYRQWRRHGEDWGGHVPPSSLQGQFSNLSKSGEKNGGGGGGAVRLWHQSSYLDRT
jgi:hypothetical protein